MRIKSLALLVFLMLALAPGIQAAQPEDDAWINVGTGVDYRLFVLQGPVRVHVARMDRNNKNVTIESSIAAGRLAYGNETVSAMARRYDGALNYWNQDWGSTGKVLVAINGSYVEDNWATPQSGQITSGWYAKRYNDDGGTSGFVWTLGRIPFIGDCVYHKSDKQFISFSDGSRLEFQGINTARGADQLILYTPQYDTHTRTNDYGVEVLVEMTRPTLILPAPYSVTGVIRQIRIGNGRTVIPFDHIVLSAHGKAAEALLAKVKDKGGEQVNISQEITNCSGSSFPSWTKSFSGVSGHFFFIKNGDIDTYPENSGATALNPRTAVAYDDSYIYFIVVDGRAPGYSIGMSIESLAKFTRDYLGAPWGIAQDGGGSSTMVINGQVVNRPSDLCYHVFLPHVTNQDGGSPPPFVFDPVVSFDRVNLACERRVGNGLMMVEVITPEFSAAFSLKYHAMYSTRGLTNVRLGPGNNYPVIATLPPDARKVEILDHTNGLEGVYAKDHYWWKVKWGDIEGWVIEDALVEFASILPAWKYLR